MSLKQLRIAFAMGGGVSLGTFSGAALTEALKTLMITAYTSKTKKYDDVVIDVFSGASAGSIALGIMIRMMVGYDDKLLLLNDLDKYKDCDTKKEIKDTMWENLCEEYQGIKQINDEEKKEHILSCQIAQDFQELIWVNKVTIDGLADLKNKNSSLLTSGGLLSSEFLESLAKDLIYPNGETSFIKNEKSPLNKRFLFCCTLTKLYPENINAFNEFHSDFYDEKGKEFLKKLLPIVGKDGATSNNHRDLRVFDFDLRPNEEKNIDTIAKPRRWIRVHDKKTSDENKNSFSLYSVDTWNTITQTTLACGAFPFAFEPKALKRRSFELSNDPSQTDQTYAYIDGGVLNNEPISEAFRLSSFMDGTYQREDFDRVVIFVDPSISQVKQTRANNVYNNYIVSEENGKTYKVTNLSKLFSHITPLVKVIRDQSTISELDKASDTLGKFTNRDNLRRLYVDTVRFGFPKDWNKVENEEKEEIKNKLNEVIKIITGSIEKLQENISIPSSFPILDYELRKLLRSDERNNYFLPKFKDAFTGINRISRNETLSNPEFFIKKHPDLIQDYSIFLYFMMIDASMDLIGKDPNYALIPIGPVIIDENGVKPTELMGQPFSAFLGFFHKDLRLYDFITGMRSAHDILCSLNVTDYCNRKPPRELPRMDEQLRNEIKYKVSQFLEKRIFNELIKTNLPDLLDMKGSRFGLGEELIGIGRRLFNVKDKILDLADNLDLEQEKFKKLEIRIKVNSKNAQLNYFPEKGIKKILERVGNKDLFPIKLPDEDELFIVFTGEFIYRSFAKDESRWVNSMYIKKGSVQLARDGFAVDYKLIDIKLPTTNVIDKVKNFLYPVIELDLSSVDMNTNRRSSSLREALKKVKLKWRYFDAKTAND